jgi:uncharacterized protein YfiM (DUF2279 family)
MSGSTEVADAQPQYETSPSIFEVGGSETNFGDLWAASKSADGLLRETLPDDDFIPAAQEKLATQGSEASEHNAPGPDSMAIFLENCDEELQRFAMANFAIAAGRCESEVVLSEVENSPEGLYHWAWLKVDDKQSMFGSRKPLHQRFCRALAHNDDAAAIFKDLNDPLKLEFKAIWAIKKNFGFTSERRQISVSFKKKTEDQGKYLNELQIARELGGNDSVEAQRQAVNYMQKCTEFGAPFILYNEWTKSQTFLYVERLISSSHEKEWIDVVEQSNSSNIWEDRAKECRARRNYAAQHNLCLERVSLDMVQSTELGVDGYAEIVVAIAAKAKAKASAKTKATAKTKVKAIAAEGGAVNVEKTLRSLIALDFSQTIAMTKIAQRVESCAEKWSWAKDFLQELTGLATDKHGVKVAHDGFLQSYAASVVCPTAMKELRKKIGKDYTTMLIRTMDAYKPLVDKYAEVLTKLERMDSVQTDGITTPKGKKRRMG